MRWCWECKCQTLACRRYADEYCWCGDVSTEDMVQYGLNRFKNTPVYKDLNTSAQESALVNAETILEWAWEWIAPFYNAVKSWKTFFDYVKKFWLTVDETWPCDDSVVENDNAFIIYVSALWTIHCKYLALDGGELINADEIAAYLNWLTTSDITYTFKDYDGTVLKIWTTEKWETPTAPSGPTREHYTFTWWDPVVWPANDDIIYIATYTPVEYTINVSVNNSSYGSVSTSEFTAIYWAAIDSNDAELFVGSRIITATAEAWYSFSSWTVNGWALPATVEWDMTILATFE